VPGAQGCGRPEEKAGGRRAKGKGRSLRPLGRCRGYVLIAAQGRLHVLFVRSWSRLFDLEPGAQETEEALEKELATLKGKLTAIKEKSTEARRG
jgi:hypothetical protein